MDLWLRLPNKKHVGYSQRDVPPAHLDVDVVAWRRYTRSGYVPFETFSEGEFGEYQGEHEEAENVYIIKKNEEIITIRDVLEGEYVVNVHYFSARGYNAESIPVEVSVQDITNHRLIYADTKYINIDGLETHFVKFTVAKQGDSYLIHDVEENQAIYFVGQEE